ncbi:MAG: ATP-binding cassette domain-containing protein [Steroidobacteraceae bacterium]
MSAGLEVRSVSVDYPVRGLTGQGTHRALDAVSVSVPDGATLGVVGESGSGKSTLARAILGLVRPSAGEVRWAGERVDFRDRAAMRGYRRAVQVVFQDPVGSLDPRMTAGASVAEALTALAGVSSPTEVKARVDAAFDSVGLDPGFAARYPHQLSGGQCQRVAIARATVARPRLLVCDEAVSALDVSVQAQIVNLLLELRDRYGLGLLFISHNLAVVRHVCDRVAVLRAGRLVEEGPASTLFAAPRHPYTRALLASVPDPDPVRARAALQQGPPGAHTV